MRLMLAVEKAYEPFRPFGDRSLHTSSWSVVFTETTNRPAVVAKCSPSKGPVRTSGEIRIVGFSHGASSI